MITLLLATLCLQPQGPGISTAPVVINEFSYDDTGTDDREFIELFNRSTSPVVITGWKVRRTAHLASPLDFTISAAVLNPGQFYLLAASAVIAPMIDQVIPNDSLPNGAASLELLDLGNNLIDSIVYETYQPWTGLIPEPQPIFPNFLSTDGQDTSWSRCLDGLDSNRNASDFRLARRTPRAANNSVSVTTYAQNANAISPSNPIPGWYGAHDVPRSNAAVGFSSPQGGNVLRFAPPAGGGGTCYWLEDTPNETTKFDAWVYLDAMPMAAGQRHVWTIGIRGGTEPLYDFPDPTRTVGTDNNGDRGMGWTYVVTQSGATLYLIDNNDGARDHHVLATLPILASGWQRLSLDARAHYGNARFGGTVGAPNGTLYSVAVHHSHGNLYVGLGASVGAIARSVYLDDLRDDDVPPIVATGGSGCQGDCEEVNAEATKNDEEVSMALRGDGTGSPEVIGNYAILVTPPVSGFTPSYVCCFTASKKVLATASTVTLREVAMNGTPAGIVLGTATQPLLYHVDASTTATISTKPGWWAAATTGLGTRTTPFFVDFTFDSAVWLPIRSYETDLNGDPAEETLILSPHWKLVSAVWQVQPQQAWTLAFVCNPETGQVGQEMLGLPEVGGTFTDIVMGGGSNSFAVGVIGFSTINVPIPNGCLLYPSPDVTSAFLTTSLGMAGWTIAVPNVPGLVGAVLISQWFTFDPTWPYPLPFTSTPYMSITIQ